MEPTQAGNGESSKSLGLARSGQLRKNGVSGFTLFFRVGIPAILLGVDAQVITNRMIGENHIKTSHTCFEERGSVFTRSACLKPLGAWGSACVPALPTGHDSAPPGYFIPQKNKK
ncbi:hypothetical protein [Ralstonia sp. UNC404CL21Col]|uniref:hypothetical protein n=1 Tax=Ralstonia sp. UNC404CL21Col TaxID=1380362 RepID=UPI001E4D0209|nr:hypothetical protein [Ralstonia sp. UNC404CL21Col]